MALVMSMSACARVGTDSGTQPGTRVATGSELGAGESSPSTPSGRTGSETAAPLPTLDGSDGLDAAPDILEIDGAAYSRGAAVPWFDATLGYGALAVTTGPETRGACDESFYRLTVSRSGAGPVTVTSHEYARLAPPPDRACVAIGLPPAVATIPWPPGFADVTTVVDGVTGQTHAVRRLWAPRSVPDGFVRDVLSGEWPQVVDPSRPAPFGPGISWSGPAGMLTLGEYGQYQVNLPPVDHVTVRGSTADVVTGMMFEGDRCLQWDDPVIGKSYLCSAGADGTPPLGVDALAALADSLAKA